MKKYVVVSILVLAAVMFLGYRNAEATSLWGTSVTNPADLNDSRSFDATLGGHYPGLAITWNIAFNGSTNLWDYCYTFNNPTGSPEVSHFILELTNGSGLEDLSNIEGTAEFNDSWGPSSGNPGFPSGAEIYGVKFDWQALNYSFSTELSPVWGNFFVKGGSDYYAYNHALAMAGFDSENILDFIVRPNGCPPVVPEPTSLSLMGLGLFGLLGFRKKKKG